MQGQELKLWRRQWNITQAKLGALLSVHRVTVAQWEIDKRKIPAFLALALKELERQLMESKINGTVGGMPGVQQTE